MLKNAIESADNFPDPRKRRRNLPCNPANSLFPAGGVLTEPRLWPFPITPDSIFLIITPCGVPESLRDCGNDSFKDFFQLIRHFFIFCILICKEWFILYMAEDGERDLTQRR